MRRRDDVRHVREREEDCRAHETMRGPITVEEESISAARTSEALPNGTTAYTVTLASSHIDAFDP